MSLWMHVDNFYCGVDRANVVHAITAHHFGEVRQARRERRSRRKTYDAVCGRRFVKLMVVGITGRPGEHVTHGWPPPVRHLAQEDRERCRECWIRTGRKRPHSLWKTVNEGVA